MASQPSDTNEYLREREHLGQRVAQQRLGHLPAIKIIK